MKSSPSRHQLLTFGLAAIGLLLLSSALAHAHELDRRIPFLGEQPMDWHTDQIARTMTFGEEVGRVVALDGKRCLEGKSFNFDVDDRFAFDIDETVRVEVEFYQHREAAVPTVSYEKNGEAEAKVRGQIPGYKDGLRAHKVTFALERARFANRGVFMTDFSIASGDAAWTSKQTMTICSISLKRSDVAVAPKDFGAIALEVNDETGKAVPARVGIYDRTGRLPLPSEEAVAVSRLGELARVFTIDPSLTPWPVRNPSVFYIDGAYRAKLPVGEYELVVAKGPEYRLVRRSFAVHSDRTQTLKIHLKRWDDLPAKGWYSGDVHVHSIRHGKNDDPNLLRFMQAEDVHVANVLQWGNIATVYGSEYGWESVPEVTDGAYSIVPGQEDPRTPRRGHTLSLRLKEPIRDPRHYLLYDEVFEKARMQGGVTGYAHTVGEGAFNARAGLALDMPSGLVDFVEVMQFGYAGSSLWFDLLNLGFRVAPGAGTDFLGDGTPGAERSYVHVKQPFSAQGWFDAFKRGETFVTNGPMLEFTVNGQPMGSQLRLKAGDKLTIHAAASINPDIDSLASLELIEQGEVVKTINAKTSGAERLQLHHETTARHGTWFVIRARGKLPHEPKNPMPNWQAGQGSAKIALSGAVYVYVDDQSFWKPSAVPSIVRGFKKSLEEMMAPETGDSDDPGTRETVLTVWDSQKGLLEKRVAQAVLFYDRLVAQAQMAVEKR